MGRYYGFIEAPATRDQKLLSPDGLPMPEPTAAPYSGPPRPAAK